MDLFAMSAENTQRIHNQNDRNISVIIGNPPYNARFLMVPIRFSQHEHRILTGQKPYFKRVLPLFSKP